MLHLSFPLSNQLHPFSSPQPLNPLYFTPKPIIQPPPCWVHSLTFFPRITSSHVLVFGNPACHLRPIRARQVFLPEVIIKRCRGDGEVGALGSEVGGSTMRKTGVGERQRERGGPTYVTQGRVFRFKEGFSHYDSATVYCILQRPYYKELLAFMLHSHGESNTCMGNRGRICGEEN